jgi:hypothetical protein
MAYGHFDSTKTEKVKQKKWFALPNLSEPTILMPVPAFYNFITQNITILRHFEMVWYARDFFVHNIAPR